jgi:hypothetical protein
MGVGWLTTMVGIFKTAMKCARSLSNKAKSPVINEKAVRHRAASNNEGVVDILL